MDYVSMPHVRLDLLWPLGARYLTHFEFSGSPRLRRLRAGDGVAAVSSAEILTINLKLSGASNGYRETPMRKVILRIDSEECQ